MCKKIWRSSSICFFTLLLLCILALAASVLFIPEKITLFQGEQLPSYPCLSLVEQTAQTQEEGSYSASVCLFGLVPLKEIEVERCERSYLVPGGDMFGVKILSDGVTIAGFSEVTVGGRRLLPARDVGMKEGDVILSIDAKPILSVGDVTRAVEEADGKAMSVVCRRGNETLSFRLVPQKCDTDGKYKTGIWVKDTTSGIGTVTFIDPKTGEFGGLGHGICDANTGNLISFRRGAVTGVHIKGITKGVSGTPGEVRGTLDSAKCGSLLSNTECGVFGVFRELPDASEAIPVAAVHEVRTGRAKILSAVSGERREYDITITAIHHRDGTKCFTVKVVDEELLALTGGIIQGMSGSPIIQDGRLVGAVTHVMIGDPTSGYGIFIENMLNAAETQVMPKAA